MSTMAYVGKNCNTTRPLAPLTPYTKQTMHTQKQPHHKTQPSLLGQCNRAHYCSEEKRQPHRVTPVITVHKKSSNVLSTIEKPLQLHNVDISYGSL